MIYQAGCILIRYLKKQVLTADNACDGKEAIEAATENPDIEIILMDIQLPVMDGYGAAKKIREFGNDVIIIAQTAYSLLGDREKIIASGFDDYIVKPIFPQQLIDKLTRAIRKTEP